MAVRKAASQTVVGLSDVIDVTLTAVAEALSDNDVIAAPQEVAGFFRYPGGTAWLHSITLIDEDDQAQDVELVFLNATGSIGNEGAAYAPADAVLRTILGTVLISASDYSDASNGQTATKPNVGLLLKAAESSSSVWIAAVCRSGTPTYSASGLRLKISVSWD